jgi:hypothetical protein
MLFLVVLPGQPLYKADLTSVDAQRFKRQFYFRFRLDKLDSFKVASIYGLNWTKVVLNTDVF